ncbi:MAG: YHYH protein [Rhodocyclaceae bacterium]|nr:YHYH protein [Rhodocyclaceae bacterium]
MRGFHSCLLRVCVASVGVIVSLGGCGNGGGGSNVAITPSITAPGAPTIGIATPADSSASIAFTPPASTGGSAITSYTATCTGGGVTRTATGAASPIVVAALTNGTVYTYSVTATNAAGVGAASASVSVTPANAVPVSGSTAGVLCTYSTNQLNDSPSVRATSTSSWTCSSTSRMLVGNGIPDHAVGTFPNPDNPHTISAQPVAATYTLTPAIANANGSTAVIVGHALNGVKFEPATIGTCDNTGSNCTRVGSVGPWIIEALTQTTFRFGTDVNTGHVQPSGEYHYHGMPENFITKLGKGTGMALVGWAADGFPVYARYGYVRPNDATSGTKVLVGSYRTKATPDANRPPTTLYAMGTFSQDWEYVAGLGDLDQCNGRTGVTPEFPQGIYHYVITDTYPFMQRCLKGASPGGGGRP